MHNSTIYEEQEERERERKIIWRPLANSCFLFCFSFLKVRQTFFPF